MSKYDLLWQHIAQQEAVRFSMTFDEIEQAGSIPIDHSFLRFKRELEAYGFRVEKISMKEKTVLFERITDREQA